MDLSPFSSIDEDPIPPPTITITIGDIETLAQDLVVSATSSNPSLVPNSALVWSGSGAERILTVLPDEHAFGDTTITISLTDGDNATVQHEIAFSVNPINDLPSSADNTIEATEDETYRFSLTEFHFEDVETASLAEIRIDGLPAFGLLTRGTASVGVGQIKGVRTH